MRELLDELKEVRRKLHVKKDYYFPSIEKAFVGLEAMLKNRVTSNGHLLRRKHELNNRWKSLRNSVSRFEKDLIRSERSLRADAEAIFSASTLTNQIDDSIGNISQSPSTASNLSLQSISQVQQHSVNGGNSVPSPTRPYKSLLRSNDSSSFRSPPSRSISLASLSSTASTPPQKPPKSTQRDSSLPHDDRSRSVPSKPTGSTFRGAGTTQSRFVSTATDPGRAAAMNMNANRSPNARMSTRRPPPSPSPTKDRTAAQLNHSVYSSSWQPRSSILDNGLPRPPSIHRPSSRAPSPSLHVAPSSAGRSKTPQQGTLFTRATRAGSEPPGEPSSAGWRARVESRLAARREGATTPSYVDDSMESIDDVSFTSSSTMHRPRAGSALGFSSENRSAVARPREIPSRGASRPLSMLGNYYRPPSVSSTRDDAEALAGTGPSMTTDRSSKRSSFIPRLSSTPTIHNGFQGDSPSKVQRPGSALSNASNDSLMYASPARSSLGPGGRHRSTASASYSVGNRLSMQTPEPVIAARAQRLSMFAKPSGVTGAAGSATRRTTRPPVSRYSIVVAGPFRAPPELSAIRATRASGAQ